jgi:hypothetical protein
MDRGLKGELRPVLVYPHAYEDPLRMLLWARNSRNSLFVGAGVFGLCALLLALVRRWRAAPYALALLAAVELLVFAFHALPTFDPVHTRTAMEVTQLQAGDSRVLNLYNANEGMQSGLYDVWGRGPDVRRRWAEYIYFAQEEPMELVCQYCAFRHWDRWRMLLPTRLTYPLLPGSGGQPVMAHLSGALERLTLVKRWRVLTDRDQVLSAMLDEAFDPRQVVILEHSPELVRARPQATLAASVPAASMPVGAPAAALVGSVRCTQRDTGFSVIEADLSSPAVLLITDAYDRSWRATALPGSAQAQYRLMPGDWAFQAVPLVAGHHRLRIEYRPAAYEVGKWISLTALAGYLGTWLWLWRARKNTRPRDTE